MSWAAPRAVVVGNGESGCQDTGAQSRASGAVSRPQVRRFDLLASLLGVAAAGLVHGVAGVESRWVPDGFLSAVAGGCAFPVFGASIHSGRGGDACLGIAVGVAGFVLAYLARSGVDGAMGGAYAAYALIGLFWDWRAERGTASSTPLTRPWTTFHAVMTLLVVT